MMSGIKRFRRALGYAALAALALAGIAAWSHAANQAGSNVMSMKSDLANREKDIHWPQGFDPSQADLFSHNELLINASCARIWSHLSRAAFSTIQLELADAANSLRMRTPSTADLDIPSNS